MRVYVENFAHLLACLAGYLIESLRPFGQVFLRRIKPKTSLPIDVALSQLEQYARDAHADLAGAFCQSGYAFLTLEIKPGRTKVTFDLGMDQLSAHEKMAFFAHKTIVEDAGKALLASLLERVPALENYTRVSFWLAFNLANPHDDPVAPGLLAKVCMDKNGAYESFSHMKTRVLNISSVLKNVQPSNDPCRSGYTTKPFVSNTPRDAAKLHKALNMLARETKKRSTP